MKRVMAVGGVVGAVVVAVGVAAADAPTGRFSISDQVVSDNVTGRLWQRAVAPGTYNWAQAKSYCAALDLGGHSDWRLPSMKELQTIVDETRVNPAIDASVFPSTPSEYFWSSSPVSGSTPHAWYVHFSNGYPDFDVVSNTYRVRCVR